MINYYYISDNNNELYSTGPRGMGIGQYNLPKVISFDMIPIAQQRPRTRVIQPKNGKPYAQIYTVNSKHKKKLLKMLVPTRYWEEATFLYCLALYKPPKSYNNYNPEKSWGDRKVTKPDGTNILKFYEDLLEGLWMPKDQFVNPTMCERYYHSSNKVVLATSPTAVLNCNIPKILKRHFLNEYEK